MDHLWHKCHLFWPRRAIDGKWIVPGHGQMWRRKRAGRWEYQQDEETLEAFVDRQW